VINFVVNEQQLIDIHRTFGDIKGSLETIISSGVNSAMRATRKESVARITDESTLSEDRVLKAFSLSRASTQKLSGKMKCSQQPIGLIAYGATRVLDGVAVSTFRKGTPKIIRHMFIGDIKGVQHVFAREIIYKKPWKPWFPYRALPRSWRYPLKRESGPSAYGLFVMKSIIDPVVIYAGLILADRISKAFYRYALKHPEAYSEFLDDF